MAPARLHRVEDSGGEGLRKYGRPEQLQREVEAMTFVRENTSIPVPTVHEIHAPKGAKGNECWILLQRVPGIALDKAWVQMDKDAQEGVTTQLRRHLDELHALQPPQHGTISSCSGGQVYDHRLGAHMCCGPFNSVREFHDFLIEPVAKHAHAKIVAKYRVVLPDDCAVQYTHADLSWEHIMVDPSTNTITGILDWEMAGFWPEWWEYSKALSGWRHQVWWENVVRQVTQAFPDVMHADRDIEMF
ncbi:kinase-like domain-containing protein [Elsinoe ampelina]|uniref:Kinase-like domain-containing protein n=1 Tax=Elsinoe ampelina TaxID=302913 RepID=A0A6A6GCR1_9PEZI|nr:kinase-like domain-containing protein [Elsinoe ampelina]